jgi:hypothetical protein
MGMEGAEEIGCAGKDGEAHRPAIAAESGAEAETGPKRFVPVALFLDEGDHRLGNHESDVALQAILKPLKLSGLFIHPRRGINPDLTPLHTDGEGPDIIGPGVEGTATRKIKASVVPVTGQDPVVERAAVQGKPHVRASIVNRVDGALVQEQGNSVSFHLEDLTPP